MDDVKSATAAGSCAIIMADCEGGRMRVAGLSVLDRLVVSLSRAGIRRIVLIGAASEPLPRSEALGIRVEHAESVPDFSIPVLWTRANIFVSAADLRRVTSSGARLVLRTGERLPLGLVDGALADWESRLDCGDVVTACDPAGMVTDERAARQLERDYWSSLTSLSDGWVDRWFNRPVGRWLSLILVETPVTPNQVSIAAIVIGLIAAGLMAVGTWWTAVWGALVLQLSAIVDCVDGDLARALCRESVVGKWLDIVGDQVVHLAVFLGLGVGLLRSGYTGPALGLGIMAGAGVILSFLVVVRVSMRPELRGDGAIQRFIDAATNRDFSAVLILFAVGGILPLFLWLAAVGSHLFWLAVLALQIRDRRSANEQVS
jgi:phosphatidylglycerophosphate synthase